MHGVAGVGILIAKINRKLAADDRLDSVTRHLVGEFQGSEHVVGVGQRQGGLAVGLGQLAELGDLDRSLQQRISGMDVEMDESGVGHGRWGGAYMGHGDERPFFGALSPSRLAWAYGDGLSEKSLRTKASLRPASCLSPITCQSWEMSCAQTAIIPTNRVIEASAAASSMKAFNIAFPSISMNISRTMFLFCSIVKGRRKAAF